jgi:hypothetical protein
VIALKAQARGREKDVRGNEGSKLMKAACRCLHLITDLLLTRPELEPKTVYLFGSGVSLFQTDFASL